MLGDGCNFSLWHDKWLYNDNLKNLFPLLFFVADKTKGTVRDHGCWRDNKWVWDLAWIWQLSAEQNVEWQGMNNVILSTTPTFAVADKWHWCLDKHHVF